MSTQEVILTMLLAFFGYPLLLFLIRSLVGTARDVINSPIAEENKGLANLIANLPDFRPEIGFISSRRSLNGIAIDFTRKKVGAIFNNDGKADPRVFTHREIRNIQYDLIKNYVTVQFKNGLTYQLYFSNEDFVGALVNCRLIEALIQAAREEAGEDMLAELKTDAVKKQPLSDITNPALQFFVKKGPQNGEFLIDSIEAPRCLLTNKNLYTATLGTKEIQTFSFIDTDRLEIFNRGEEGASIRLHLKSGEVVDVEGSRGFAIMALVAFQSTHDSSSEFLNMAVTRLAPFQSWLSNREVKCLCSHLLSIQHNRILHNLPALLVGSLSFSMTPLVGTVENRIGDFQNTHAAQPSAPAHRDPVAVWNAAERQHLGRSR